MLYLSGGGEGARMLECPCPSIRAGIVPQFLLGQGRRKALEKHFSSQVPRTTAGAFAVGQGGRYGGFSETA